MTISSPRNLNKDNQEDSTPLRRHRYNRRHLFYAVSCVVTSVFLFVLALLITILTVYKVRDPILTLNSLTLTNLTVSGNVSGADAGDVAGNITFIADVSVKNPNAASFQFPGSTTSVYYRAHTVAVAEGPAGIARARRTLRLNLTIDVSTGEILGGAGDLAGDLDAGSLHVDTSTKVGGHVRILGIIKRHVDVVMNCSVNIAVVNQSIMSQNCKQKVWI